MACGTCGASDHYTADHVEPVAVQPVPDATSETKPAERKPGLFRRLFQ